MCIWEAGVAAANIHDVPSHIKFAHAKAYLRSSGMSHRNKINVTSEPALRF